MATCTNVDLGRALDLSHSTVSRMRSGTRTGSLATLRRLAQVTGRPLEEVADAAEKARRGDLTSWHALLDLACTGSDDAAAE